MNRHLLVGLAVACSVIACDAGSDDATVEAREEPATGVEPAPPVQDAPRASELIDEGPERHLLYRSEEVSWQAGPPSLPEGIEMVVLEGDPAEPGVFTLRFRAPDGYVVPPHWHPNVERITVISGTFLLGSGDELDEGATEALGPGSYTSMPPETRHYAIARGETVIQLTSVGPWVITYIDPDDDPRRRD